MNSSFGTLYIVATPIGNLQDITYRAIDVLKSVDLIAAEDTRHSKKLLTAYQIHTDMIAYHAHNEQKSANLLIDKLKAGLDIALISDAGTPLISDPGYTLVQHAHEKGITVTPIPGPSALIAGLSVAGLPTQPVSFYGFIPNKSAARRDYFASLTTNNATLVFYESPHRILASVKDMQDVFGDDRHAVLMRELTKTFETILTGTLSELVVLVENDSNQQRGEIVVFIAPAEVDTNAQQLLAEQLMRLLLAELPVKTASKITAEVSGISKNSAYELGLKMRDEAPK